MLSLARLPGTATHVTTTVQKPEVRASPAAGAAREPGYGSSPGGASGWEAPTAPGKKWGGCWLAGFRSKGEMHVREKQ